MPEEQALLEMLPEAANAVEELPKSIRDAMLLEVSPEIIREELETSMRKLVVELTVPTVRRTTNLEQLVRQLHADVQRATIAANALDHLRHRVDDKFQRIDAFVEEMRHFDAERRSDHLSSTETMARLSNELDALRYRLEQKDSTVHSLQRTADRILRELGQVQDGGDVTRKHVDARLQETSRLLNSSTAELEVKVLVLESKHHQLCDKVWSEETALAKAREEFMKIQALVGTLGTEVTQIKKDSATVEHLTSVQTDVINKIAHNSQTVEHLKESHGVVVESIKEQFKIATDTVASNTAETLINARDAYKAELDSAAALRDEIVSFMHTTKSSMQHLEMEVKRSQEEASGAVGRLTDDMAGLKARRRESTEVVVQERTGCSDDVRLEHLSGVLWTLIQSERAAAALDLQDDIDRTKLSLMGYREVKKEGKERRVEAGRRRQGSASPSPVEIPVVSVDPRCHSCSGQAQAVLAGFKMACLEYAPGPVNFAHKTYSRNSLQDIRQRLLEQACEQLQKGPNPIKNDKIDKNDKDLRVHTASTTATIPAGCLFESQSRASSCGRPCTVDSVDRVGFIDRVGTANSSASCPSVRMPPLPARPVYSGR